MWAEAAGEFSLAVCYRAFEVHACVDHLGKSTCPTPLQQKRKTSVISLIIFSTSCLVADIKNNKGDMKVLLFMVFMMYQLLQILEILLNMKCV